MHIFPPGKMKRSLRSRVHSSREISGFMLSPPIVVIISLLAPTVTTFKGAKPFLKYLPSLAQQLNIHIPSLTLY